MLSIDASSRSAGAVCPRLFELCIYAGDRTTQAIGPGGTVTIQLGDARHAGILEGHGGSSSQETDGPQHGIELGLASNELRAATPRSASVNYVGVAEDLQLSAAEVVCNHVRAGRGVDL